MSIDGYDKLEGIEAGAEVNTVDSVFSRTGAVVAVAGDYDSDQVDNASTVTGATVSDALEQLSLDITNITNTVLDGYVPDTIQIIAGAGLTGGGDLTTNRTINIVSADSSITVNADSIQVGTINSTQHASQTDGALHAVATISVNGFMSSSDKTKLDGLPTSAAPTTRNLIAGAGLTGGGDLSSDRTFNIAAADSSITVNADSIQVGTINSTQHGNQTSGSLHAVATISVNGFMSATDKTKLDGIASGANVVGAASSTDNAIVRFDGTTGKLIQNSGITIDDTNNIITSNNNITLLKTATFNDVIDNGTAPAGTKNINFDDGQKQKVTLTGNALLNLQCTRIGNYMFIITQDATGARNPTWQGNGVAANVKGPSGTIRISSAASSVTVLGIFYDGTLFYVTSSTTMSTATTTLV
jgi:hypothetical protein